MNKMRLKLAKKLNDQAFSLGNDGIQIERRNRMKTKKKMRSKNRYLLEEKIRKFP